MTPCRFLARALGTRQAAASVCTGMDDALQLLAHALETRQAAASVFMGMDDAYLFKFIEVRNAVY